MPKEEYPVEVVNPKEEIAVEEVMPMSVEEVPCRLLEIEDLR
jgi:hypothetical protein